MFVREHGGVRLTEEGKLLLPEITRINNAKRMLDVKINEIRSLDAGTIRIVSFDIALIYWIPEIVKKFHDNPGIQFEFISCEDMHAAARMIQNGDADCGFFWADVNSQIDTFTLFKEPMVVVVSENHPAAERKSFTKKMMEQYPYVAMKNDDRSEIADIFESIDFHPHAAFTMESDFACLSMISQGLGYGIFSKTAADRCGFPVKAINFSKHVFRNVSLGVRSRKNCSDIVERFIEHVESVMKR